MCQLITIISITLLLVMVMKEVMALLEELRMHPGTLGQIMLAHLASIVAEVMTVMTERLKTSIQHEVFQIIPLAQ